MSAGYSGTPSWRKLGIKEGHQVATAGAPTHFGALLDPLPASVLLWPDLRARGPFDVLVVFVRTEAELRSRFTMARKRLDSFGGLWVAWPKRSSFEIGGGSALIEAETYGGRIRILRRGSEGSSAPTQRRRGVRQRDDMAHFDLDDTHDFDFDLDFDLDFDFGAALETAACNYSSVFLVY